MRRIQYSASVGIVRKSGRPSRLKFGFILMAGLVKSPSSFRVTFYSPFPRAKRTFFKMGRENRTCSDKETREIL